VLLHTCSLCSLFFVLLHLLSSFTVVVYSFLSCSSSCFHALYPIAFWDSAYSSCLALLFTTSAASIVGFEFHMYLIFHWNWIIGVVYWWLCLFEFQWMICSKPEWWFFWFFMCSRVCKYSVMLSQVARYKRLALSKGFFLPKGIDSPLDLIIIWLKLLHFKKC